jgi:FkbM family methyltransferase
MPTDMRGESFFKILIWLGQKFPLSWRVALTQSSMAAWLRRLSLLPLTKGQVMVALSAPLTGYRMKLDMRSGHRRYALGTYEPEVCALIQSYLSGGETVLDIGANIGYFTLLMAHRAGPAGRVIAFEPVPSVYDRLCENLELNDLHHVQAERKAVADREGQSQMQLEDDAPLSFTARLAESGDLAVQTMSIDSYVETNGLDRLDFVKIDVEGAEDAVIRGMNRTLGSLRPAVLVEIHAKDGSESETLKRLKENGYHLRRLEPDGWTICDTRARGGHVLAEIDSFDIHD